MTNHNQHPTSLLYQQKLKECNALDFDDLLYLTVKLLKENETVRKESQKRWIFVLIDEYQDTNLAQYSMAKILVDDHKNIYENIANVDPKSIHLQTFLPKSAPPAGDGNFLLKKKPSFF